jgi:uncharacterized protein YpmB
MRKRGVIGALIILILFVIVAIVSACGPAVEVKTAEQMIKEARERAMNMNQVDTLKSDTVQ